jgi:hypothetical protein
MHNAHMVPPDTSCNFTPCLPSIIQLTITITTTTPISHFTKHIFDKMAVSNDSPRYEDQVADLQQSLQEQDDYLNQHLKLLFNDPIAFRLTQAACNGLISGPFARRFFARTLGSLCDAGDMIVVIENNPEAILDFLQADDYTREDGGSGSERYNHHKVTGTAHNVVKVFTWDQERSPEKRSTGPFYLLEFAESTADLNFISWNKAYSMYPVETFLAKHAHMFLEHDLHFAEKFTLETLRKEGIRPMGIHWDQRGEGLLGKDTCITRRSMSVRWSCP